MQTLCPLLGRETSVRPTPFQRDRWMVVQCEETGFVFLANPPDYAQLESEFAWEKTCVAERGRRVQDEPLFSQLSNFAKTAKKTIFPKRNKMAAIAVAIARQTPPTSEPLQIMDIGCGSGSLLVAVTKALQPHGYQVVPIGVEVSQALAAESARDLMPWNGQVIQNNAFDGLAGWPEASVGAVLMSSFLEHERQPLALLLRLRQILKPDGFILLKVPNFNCLNRRLRGRRWCGFRYPDHVNYFTPGTLSRLSHEAGLRVARQTWFDKAPLSDNMYAVLKLA